MKWPGLNYCTLTFVSPLGAILWARITGEASDWEAAAVAVDRALVDDPDSEHLKNLAKETMEATR